MKNSILVVFLTYLSLASLSICVGQSTNLPMVKAKKQLGENFIPWIQNKGQYHPDIAFATKTFAADIMIRKNGSIGYSLNSSGKKALFLEESFLNPTVSPTTVTGMNRARTSINYFRGNKRNNYTNIPSYHQLDLGEIWPGIDVKLKATRDNFEKILTVHPNGNADQIQIRIKGALDLCENEAHELQLDLEEGDISFTKPKAWQNIEGKTIEIDVSYRVNLQEDQLSYGFELGSYETGFPVYIDPLLASGFLGGGMFDYAQTVKIGKKGDVFVGGVTKSYHFPVTNTAYDQVFNDSTDIFVARISSDLSVLEVCTFIGGSDKDFLYDMLLDDRDNVYFTGRTTSEDYPTTPNVFDTSYNNPGYPFFGDMIISRLNPKLNMLDYSTFLGSEGEDYGKAMGRDSLGNIYITGLSDFGIPAVGPQFEPTTTGFIFFKIDTSLSKILASNSISGDDYILPWDLSVDSSGNVLITGSTAATNLPTTATSYLDSIMGKTDAFIVKLNYDLSTLLASTYVGGKADDYAFCIINDSLGNVYISGETSSANFPFSLTAYDTIYSNPNNLLSDAFVCILDSNLQKLGASTFLGGNAGEIAYSLALDSLGNIYVSGFTLSSDFPVFCNSYSNEISGAQDCFLSKFKRDLSGLMASTYIGGSKNDHAYTIAINDKGEIYTAGYTQSTDFPTYAAFDTSYNGGESDGFILKMGAALDSPHPCCSQLIYPSPNSTDNQRDITLSWQAALGATGYFISVGSSEGQYNILDHEDVGNTTAYSLDNLTCGDSIFVYIYPYNGNGINKNCDSFWFKIHDPFSQNDFADICEGDSFEWLGDSYLNAGTYTKTYTDIFGCDSIYQLVLSIHPTYGFQDYAEICAGDYYYWQGNYYDTSGTYFREYKTLYDCDSSYALTVLVYPSYEVIMDSSICAGDTIYWEGQYISSQGIYTAYYLTQEYCDSIIYMNLNHYPGYTFYDSASICAGDYFDWQGSSYGIPGNYSIEYQTTDGCDSSFYLTLDLNPNYYFTEQLSICENDSVHWQGMTLDSTGIYYASYQTVYDCDSIYQLELLIYPNYYYDEQLSICTNDTIEWQDMILDTAGVYYASYQSINGCDSSYQLTLIENPVYYFDEQQSICENDTIFWQDMVLNTPGNYYAGYQTIFGCDSIYILALEQTYIDTTVTVSGDSLWALPDSNSIYQWLICPAYTLIDSATANLYIAQENGSYAVQITKDGCVDTSACHTIVLTGTVNPKDEFALKIYPNPVVKNKLNIQLNQSALPYRLELINLAGHKFLETLISGNSHQIDVSRFDAGVYIIKIISGNSMAVRKIVIVR